MSNPRFRIRGIDVSKIIWPSDFLPLCCRSFLRVDRSREEGCSLRIFPPIRPGSRAFLSLLGERAPTPRYVSSASSFSSACEDKRTSSKTDRPLATHRGLSSEGRKPGNYYVSRETRGNPDFFFPPPVKDFKGIILASGRNFLRDVNFFAGRDTVSFARIRVLLLREMYYRENIITHERELPSFFVSSNRRELSVISLFVSWGISML